MSEIFIYWLPVFRQRKDEIEGEIFEILLMFTDFVAFKEMILDYRAAS
jgi:ADP-ribosylation factor-like protein 2-binding protein